MTWTDLEFGFGTILTSSNMTNLQANFQAMADGDSGAPSWENRASGGRYGQATTALGAYQEFALLYYNNVANTDTIYFRYDVFSSNAGYSTNVKVTVNGTTDIQSTNSTSYVTKTGSISLSGQSTGWQLVEVEYQVGYANSGMKNFYFYVK